MMETVGARPGPTKAHAGGGCRRSPTSAPSPTTPGKPATRDPPRPGPPGASRFTAPHLAGLASSGCLYANMWSSQQRRSASFVPHLIRMGPPGPVRSLLASQQGSAGSRGRSGRWAKTMQHWIRSRSSLPHHRTYYFSTELAGSRGRSGR